LLSIDIDLPTPVQHLLDQPYSLTHHNAPEPPSNQPSSPTRHNTPEPPSNQLFSPTRHNAPEPPSNQPSSPTRHNTPEPLVDQPFPPMPRNLAPITKPSPTDLPVRRCIRTSTPPSWLQDYVTGSQANHSTTTQDRPNGTRYPMHHFLSNS